ncbi:hypothetical protein [Aneurinibacillus aneurinilyticus]|uniref:Uncharacterized protein n=1 Tax=Aneurinibacillus aneurinilyticus TaxID=1391 RepID=A0A848CZU8_ANEAE|nr:hypothetical protein [Aneurinibacillus aneurinilyticus]NMF01264.1 hypothetical protein [Aneurinibacillus aneurinilyticus]
MFTIIGVIIVLAVLSWIIWDKRYKEYDNTDVPAGFVRTDEVNVDPVSGKKTRVYYHPHTGERFYKKEND